MGCSCVQSYEAPGDVQFSPNQLAYIWQAAGGNMQVVGIAVAIAMRESGGHSTATCVNGGPGCSCNGCIDRGLWQIDSVHGAGSSYDVMTNARTAVALYNAQGWGPWGGAIPGLNVTPDPNTPINATQGASNNGQGAGGVTTNAQTTASVSGSIWGDILEPWKIPGELAGAGESAIWDSMKSVMLMILNPMLNVAAGTMGIAAGGTMFLFGLFMLISDAGAGSVGGGVGRLGEIGGAATAGVGLVTGQPEIMAAGGAMAGAGSGIGAAARSKLNRTRTQETEGRQTRAAERISARQQRQQGAMASRTQYQQTMLSQRQQAAAGGRTGLSAQRHQEAMERESFRTQQFGVREDLRNRAKDFKKRPAA